MLNISVFDTGGHQGPAREAESATKPKLLTEAEAKKQLDRIAPEWPLHLNDGAVIDHILKVINNPRASPYRNHATLPCPPRRRSSASRPAVTGVRKTLAS